MLKAVFFLIIFSLGKSIACEVRLNKVVMLNDISESKVWHNLKTNCSQLTINEFTKKLRYFSGEVPTAYLEQQLKKLNIQLLTEQKSISVERISEKIKKGYHPQKVRNISTKGSLKNINTSKIKIKYNEAYARLTTAENDEFPFSFEKQSPVLHSIKNITPYESKSIEFLTVKKNEWRKSNIGMQNYFFSKKELTNYLKHHTLKTFVKKGSPLKKSDFRKKPLLKFGQPVKVLFNNKNLSIETIGTPQSNGGLGDSVYVRLKNKQLISAKVVDVGVVSANL